MNPIVIERCVLVAFAAFSDHCSFFPMSSSLLTEFQADLKRYSQSKGTIRFALDKPLPAAIAATLPLIANT